MKNKKIAIIHTSFVSIDYLKALFQEVLPDVTVTNIVDDSLLAEVMENGKVTPGIINRMTSYAKQAESLGVEAILSQCSSVGAAADIVAGEVKVPLLKIDWPMAEKAVTLGEKIAVIATVASTLQPSCSLVQQAADQIGKKVTIVPALVDGALAVLIKEKNRKKHNELVRATIESLEDEVDVFFLAQASMVVLLPELTHIKKPVLSSPKLAVERMAKMLEGH